MPKDPSPPELDPGMKALAEMLIEFDPDVAEEFGHWILARSICAAIAEGRDCASIAAEWDLTVEEVVGYAADGDDDAFTPLPQCH